MKKIFFASILLISFCFSQIQFIGPASKTINIDSISIGVAKSFSDTVLFFDNPDTVAAIINGSFTVTSKQDTAFIFDTVTVTDTVQVPFTVYDTVIIQDTVIIRDTVNISVQPPIVNRYYVAGDSILEIKIDSCNYLLHRGYLQKKYFCK